MYTVEAYPVLICIRLGYLQRKFFSLFSWKDILLLCTQPGLGEEYFSRDSELTLSSLYTPLIPPDPSLVPCFIYHEHTLADNPAPLRTAHSGDGPSSMFVGLGVTVPRSADQRRLNYENSHPGMWAQSESPRELE